MLALAIIVVVIGIFLLLRVGGEVMYSEDGLRIRARIGFVCLTLYPRSVSARKRRRTKKTADKTAKAEKRAAGRERTIGKLFGAVKNATETPGSATDFQRIISGSIDLLGRLKRSLLIKRMYVTYIHGGDDAYSMAMAYGGFGAVFGVSQAVLESAFRVKRYRLETAVDYLADSPKIRAEVEITIAIWEVISLAFSAIILIMRSRKKPESTVKTREERRAQRTDRTRSAAKTDGVKP